MELHLHDRLFLLSVEDVQRLVNVAVGRDLVTRIPDAQAFLRVVLYRPRGNVEAGAEFEAVQHPQNPVHAYARVESTFFHADEAPLGSLGLSEEEA